MAFRIGVIVFCLFSSAAVCLPQTNEASAPVPKVVSSDRGALAFRAEKLLEKWMQSGNLLDIYKQKPDVAVRQLDEISRNMTAYKTAQLDFYDRWNGDLENEIKQLTAGVDLRKAFGNDASELNSESREIFKLEDRLRQELKTISGSASPKAGTTRAMLTSEISRLNELKDSIERQRLSILDAMQSDDKVQPALTSLRAQQENIKKLRDLNSQSERDLKDYYSLLRDSVVGRSQAREDRQDNSAVIAADENAARRLNRNIDKTWMFEEKNDPHGYSTLGRRVEIKLLEVNGTHITSYITLRLPGSVPNPIEIGDCNCRIENIGHTIRCTKGSTAIVLTAEQGGQLSGSLPSRLKMTAALPLGGQPDSQLWKISESIVKATDANRKENVP